MSFIEPEHLGDGAYVSFDGYNLILTANHHDPAQAADTVVIELGSIAALTEYAQRAMKEVQK